MEDRKQPTAYQKAADEMVAAEEKLMRIYAEMKNAGVAWLAAQKAADDAFRALLNVQAEYATERGRNQRARLTLTVTAEAPETPAADPSKLQA